jgi:toxin FitB
MLILDTTILEEVIRPMPDPKIGVWLGSQPRDDLYTTSIALGDILLGIERLPPGKRKTDLVAAVGEIFAFFEKRILPFDQDAARAYPTIVQNRRLMGKEPNVAGSMLAAITRSRGAMLASRTPDEFSGCGIRVIDPLNPS